jgi:hypothetical protein
LATTNSRSVATWFRLKLAMLVAGVLLAGATINGCGELDTVLFVRVEGATTGTISQFAVTVSVGEQIRAFTIPDQKKLINLPTSFTIEVPAAFEGVASIQVKALNDQGVVIGEGMAPTTAIDAGKQNSLVVQISPVIASNGDGGLPPAKDGGGMPDAPGDARLAADAGTADGGVPKLDASAKDAPVVVPDASAPDAAVVKLDAPVVVPDAAGADASEDADPPIVP